MRTGEGTSGHCLSWSRHSFVTWASRPDDAVWPRRRKDEVLVTGDRVVLTETYPLPAAHPRLFVHRWRIDLWDSA